jgi:hypothetical protein
MAEVTAPAGYRGKTKKAAATKPNALRRVKLCVLFDMRILHRGLTGISEVDFNSAFAALSPILCEQRYSSPCADRESDLSGLAGLT